MREFCTVGGVGVGKGKVAIVPGIASELANQNNVGEGASCFNRLGHRRAGKGPLGLKKKTLQFGLGQSSRGTDLDQKGTQRWKVESSWLPKL